MRCVYIKGQYVQAYIECFLLQCRVESAIMRQVVLWVTVCDFNAIILNQSVLTVSHN